MRDTRKKPGLFFASTSVNVYRGLWVCEKCPRWRNLAKNAWPAGSISGVMIFIYQQRRRFLRSPFCRHPAAHCLPLQSSDDSLLIFFTPSRRSADLLPVITARCFNCYSYRRNLGGGRRRNRPSLDSLSFLSAPSGRTSFKLSVSSTRHV